MEAVQADFRGTVDEIRFDKMIGSVGVAVHEDPAARYGAAADHLVDEGPGKQRGLVGVGAGGGHALELVLGVVLVRAEQVVGIAPDEDPSFRPSVFPGNPEGFQHAEQGREHIALQGPGRDAGQDEIPSGKTRLAPGQEGKDHGDGLAGADRAVGKEDAAVLMS